MANFTPQEIEKFLQEFFDIVGTRQYTGARYVPIFGRKGESSIAWDNTKPYEPLTIVLYQGSSFTSRQYVPAGVDILNTDYWAETGAYNAQIEQYRAEVLNLGEDFETLEHDVNEAIDAINDTVSEIREEVFGTKYMVIIGDSFSNNSQSGSPMWYTYVARQLGLTPYCNAHDGRGFGAYLSHTTYTFIQQAQKAADELNPDTVERIYVVGGLNDTRNAAFDVTVFDTGVRNVLSILTTNFPNSIIEFYGPQSFPQINKNTNAAAKCMAWACSDYGVEYHDLSAKFNAYPEFFGGNGGTGSQNSMHPSARGEKAIAQAIISHGILPQPAYNLSTLPASMATPPVLKHVWYDNSGTWTQLDDNQLSTDFLVTPDGITFEWLVGITVTSIPSTAGRLAIVVPFGYLWLFESYGSTSGAVGDLSQLPDNVTHTGWLSRTDNTIATFGAPCLLFNINGNNTLQTGAGKSNMRFRITFAQRG